jgi:hypothetical protein
MAKGIYVGVGGIPKKVKKLYVGISGVPRKVKKAYIGVGGLPRLTYSSGVEYVSGVTNLSQTNINTVGWNANYLLFAFSATHTCDAYNAQLVKTSGVAFDNGGGSYLGGKIGDKAIVAHGGNVSLFNGSLTKTSHGLYGLSDYPSKLASNSALAYFQNPYETRTLDANGTMGYGGLKHQEENCAQVSTDIYAYFAGGYWGGSATTLMTCNKNDGSYTTAYLSLAKQGVTGTKVGNYVLFAGGETYPNQSPTSAVDAFDSNLTRTSPTALSVSRSGIKAVTIDEYGLFVGGYTYSNSTYYNTVDCYDSNLVRTNEVSLPSNKGFLVGGTVGSYAILTNQTVTVDAFTA